MPCADYAQGRQRKRGVSSYTWQRLSISLRYTMRIVCCGAASHASWRTASSSHVVTLAAADAATAAAAAAASARHTSITLSASTSMTAPIGLPPPPPSPSSSIVNVSPFSSCTVMQCLTQVLMRYYARDNSVVSGTKSFKNKVRCDKVRQTIQRLSDLAC